MLNRNSRSVRLGLAAAVIAMSAFAAGTYAADKMADSPSAKAYHEAMTKMNQDMMKGMTGDPDKDFAMMMIPHHQGAIDMAKVVIQYGKDAELKKMAQDMIPEQEKGIADLKRWQNAHK
jgi:uncharacterized protein (DUF305 family)